MEALESRELLAVNVSGMPNWAEEGPGPIVVNNGVDDQVGNVNMLAVDPSNPNIIFAATANGGVWRTTTGTNSPSDGADNDGDGVKDEPDEKPVWIPVTDQQPSLSMDSIAFGPQDPTHHTIFAGFGRRSNGFGDGGPLPGLLRTTDFGDTWTVVGASALSGLNIRAIVPAAFNDPGTGQPVVLVAASGGGIFRSTDNGTSFTQVSGTHGLPAGAASDLIGDPGNAMRFYAAIPGQGVFRSNNGGVDWTIDNGTGGNVITGLSSTSTGNSSCATSSNIRLRLATTNSGGIDVAYVGVVRSCVIIPNGDNHDNGNRVVSVFRSTDQGGNWRLVQNMPQTNGVPTISPGSQAENNFEILASPTNPNVLFIGSAPNVRIRVTMNDNNPASDSWNESIESAGGVSPHDDPRNMVFDGNTLLDTSDGGISRLFDPDNASNSRRWESANGNIRPTEFYAVSYDTLNQTVFGGTQDNGSPAQRNSGNFTWDEKGGCDGGETAIDNQTAPGVSSIHYTSSQNFDACGGLVRRTYDSSNNDTNDTSAGLTVNNTNNTKLTAKDANGNFTLDPTIPFQVAYKLNAIDPARMIIGTSFLYESTDRGDHLTSLGGVQNNGGVFVATNPVGSLNPAGVPLLSPIAYGGRAGGVDNADVLWVGAMKGSDGVDNDGDGKVDESDEIMPTLRLRTSGTGMPAIIPNYPTAAGGVRDVVMDPDDWHIAYFITNNGNVYKAATNDDGSSVTFTDLTGDLAKLSTDLRTIEFAHVGNDSVLLVGGLGGVFRTINPDAVSWTKLGANLPNGLANDLHYIPSADVLLVGMYGRGAWTIGNASSVLDQNPVLNVCGDEEQINQDDQFRLVRNPANPLLLDVFVNGVMEFEGPMAAVSQINVFAAGGNDDLTVDSSNGLISVTNGIRYDGDHGCPGQMNAGIGGLDRLDLVQPGAAGPTIASDQLAPGATPGEGRSLIVDSNSNTQRVDFQYLEPVVDTVPSPLFDIASVPGLASVLDASNAINYGPAQLIPPPALAVGARVTIDNFEPIEFTNKTALTINGGAGDDKINLNNPITPTGLTTITVDGGDPTARDTLIANGIASTSDRFTLFPVAVGAGDIHDFNSAGTGIAPVIHFAGIEAVSVVGQKADADTFTQSGTSGDDTFTVDPGTEASAGTVTGSASGFDFTPVAYFGISGFIGVGSTIVENTAGNFVAVGPGPAGVGGHDTVVVDGTDADDTFNYDGTTPAPLVRVLTGGTIHTPVTVSSSAIQGLDHAVLRGLNGNDVFNLTKSSTFNGASVAIRVEGGDSDQFTDTLNFTPDTGVANTINLAASLITSSANASPIAYSGVERINLTFSGATSTLRIDGTPGDDTLNVTPSAKGAGSFKETSTGAFVSTSPLVTYTGIGDVIILNGGGGGFDQVGLIATAGNDVINAVQTDDTHLSYTQNAFTQAFVLNGPQAANIDALAGDDLIRVSVADALEANPGPSLRFMVDGGEPNASDRLLVNDDGIGDLTILRQGADERSGSVTVGALNPVVYQNIERLDITPLDPVSGGTGTDGNGRIKVFHTDPFEFNESRLTAAQLQRVGDSPTSPTIDPGALTTPFPVPGDEDWYEFRPQGTGTFQVKILFDTLAALANGRPGLPGNGDLSLDIYDANGALIVSGVPAPGGKAAIFAATNDPAFSQFNRIFVRVHGATPPSINLYDFDNIAGLITGNPGVSNLDNEGPQVTDVSINHIPTSTYNLFGQKPGNAAQGPTPATTSLVVHFQDLPSRAPGFVYPALDYFLTPDQARGLFQVQGDATGIVAIDHVVITQTPPMLGQVPTSTVELFFNSPLLDDRYSLTVSDSLRDPAQNQLDGESNADEPNGAPKLPSGDGHSGGNFVGRFTIDSRPEIGDFSAGSAFLDINGNLAFDPQGIAADYSNRDLIFQFGTISDALFAGKFEPANPALNDNDGFDKLGAYGFDNTAKKYRFLLDFNHDGVSDQKIVSAFQVNATPVAGNFAPGHLGDEIGLFDGKNWYLDNVGDNQLHVKIPSNMKGRPIVGDFNGDGKDDLATFDASTNTFFFDTNRDGLTDDSFQIFGPINGFTEIPVAGDLNLDGIDDLGIWVANRQGSPTPNISEWYFVVSDHTGQTLPHNVFNTYSPTPLGNDIFADFGDNFALPVFGNFDPPVGSGVDTSTNTNSLNPLDVDNDGAVSPSDALAVINQINTGVQPLKLVGSPATGPYTDVNGDGSVTAADVLAIINSINSHPATAGDGGEGESSLLSIDQGQDDLLAMLAADTVTAKRRL
jgi:hypothetical protein